MAKFDGPLRLFGLSLGLEFGLRGRGKGFLEIHGEDYSEEKKVLGVF